MESESTSMLKTMKYTQSMTNLSNPKCLSMRTSRAEDHPLYENLTDLQVAKYERFVQDATEKFDDLEYSIPTLRKTCLDPVNLLRFCIARNFKLKAVMKMWLQWVDWRADFRPDTLTKEDIKEVPLSK